MIDADAEFFGVEKRQYCTKINVLFIVTMKHFFFFINNITTHI